MKKQFRLPEIMQYLTGYQFSTTEKVSALNSCFKTQQEGHVHLLKSLGIKSLDHIDRAPLAEITSADNPLEQESGLKTWINDLEARFKDRLPVTIPI